MAEDSRGARGDAIPYGRQAVDEEDIEAVVEVLRSDWLTTGPMVDAFEAAVAKQAGVEHAVAVANGTAALHGAMRALDLSPGAEVILPPLTFAATANTIVHEGGTPIFADVDAGTLLVDPDAVRAHITDRTEAIVAVDYAGQPCAYDELRRIAVEEELALVSDACHSLGGAYRGRPVGSLADMTAFSFHPVKAITSGEGGMIVTDSAERADRLRRFRNHGIDADHHERADEAEHAYQVTEPGYNYRLSDIHCALGLSQLRKLDAWTARRRTLASAYSDRLATVDGIEPLRRRSEVQHAFHLFVVRVRADMFPLSRDALFKAMRAEGIGVNVHYPPVHLHPFYRTHCGTTAGTCPIAEQAYEEILSLPLFPTMTESQQEQVLSVIENAENLPMEARFS